MKTLTHSPASPHDLVHVAVDANSGRGQQLNFDYKSVMTQLKKTSLPLRSQKPAKLLCLSHYGSSTVLYQILSAE